MGNLTAMGETTKTVFLNNVESDKLHLAFEASSEVRKGQPVKMAGTDNDVIIKPVGDGTDNHAIIGYSVQNAVLGDQVTIAMKGFACIFAKCSATLVPGPVKYTGLTTGDIYTEYDQATEATMNAIALDGGDVGDIIRVVLQ